MQLERIFSHRCHRFSQMQLEKIFSHRCRGFSQMQLERMFSHRCHRFSQMQLEKIFSHRCHRFSQMQLEKIFSHRCHYSSQCKPRRLWRLAVATQPTIAYHRSALCPEGTRIFQKPTASSEGAQLWDRHHLTLSWFRKAGPTIILNIIVDASVYI